MRDAPGAGGGGVHLREDGEEAGGVSDTDAQKSHKGQSQTDRPARGLARVEAEIKTLLSTQTGANAVLMSYANGKIEELDAKRQSLAKAIADASVEAVFPEHLERISGYLQNWEGISFEDRRLVADGLISTVRHKRQRPD